MKILRQKLVTGIGIAVIGLDVLLFGEMWTLRLWIRKEVEYFNWGLMGHTSRNPEDSGAEGVFNCVGLAQEI